MKTLIFILCSVAWAKAQIPADCTQIILGTSPGWNSSHASLTLYEKRGDYWNITINTWRARLGKKGLAWGNGIHPPQASSVLIKKEGDQRTPAGIFRIGGAYGYAPKVKHLEKLPYRQITERDLWVEDPSSPFYNQHIILNNPPKTSWQQKAQMRQNDHAHSLKLYIGHNDAILGSKPIPGHGSAIFFHIWRDKGARATAGCTSMSEPALKKLIARIDPERNPIYVIIPQEEYQRLRKSWRLP
ncbi:MAG: L,D-transpeptidase family protein [Akkermansiaceae bacterium]